MVADHRPFEVTTFRRDVATDGRRAVVAFTDDLAEDAARRDFTMNALYCRPDGTVVDPLGGLADLRAGRVRFVGDPAARIAEDYLRILRFFRIHAWYGDPAGGLDPEGLAACAAQQEGLARLSRERIGAEMTKLLAAPDPAPAVAAMAASGILARVLPGADARALAPLVHLEAAAGAAPRWQRRLAALGWRPDWPDRCASPAPTPAPSRRSPPRSPQARRQPPPPGASAPTRRATRRSSAPPPSARRRLRISRPRSPAARAARLPARRRRPRAEGPALGRALKRLEAAWLASDFGLDAAALLAQRSTNGD